MKQNNRLKFIHIRQINQTNVIEIYQKQFNRFLFDYSDEVEIDGKIYGNNPKEKFKRHCIVYYKNEKGEPNFKKAISNDIKDGFPLTENDFIEHELEQIVDCIPRGLTEKKQLKTYKEYLEKRLSELKQSNEKIVVSAIHTKPIETDYKYIFNEMMKSNSPFVLLDEFKATGSNIITEYLLEKVKKYIYEEQKVLNNILLVNPKLKLKDIDRTKEFKAIEIKEYLENKLTDKKDKLPFIDSFESSKKWFLDEKVKYLSSDNSINEFTNDEIERTKKVIKEYLSTSVDLTQNNNGEYLLEAQKYLIFLNEYSNTLLLQQETKRETSQRKEFNSSQFNEHTYKLFCFIVDEYKKDGIIKFINIWYFLKRDIDKKKYNNILFNFTQDKYKEFVKKYDIEIKNFKKAEFKYQDDEVGILQNITETYYKSLN